MQGEEGEGDLKHETRNTVSVLKWCNACGRSTQHACSDRRVGRCMEHAPEGLSKKQEAARKEREDAERSPRLL